MDFLLDLLAPLLIGPFFLTGELLRKLASGGERPVRWWDHDDANTSTLSTVIGVVFWAVVIWIAVLLWP